MKLFSRPAEGSDWTGFLDRGSRVEGTLDVPGTFRVDGAVKGRILSRQLLVLGPEAEIEGEIEGERVVVYDRFRGTLRASSRVEIHAQASVCGDIYTPCLLLEPGGRLEGHCYLNSAGTAADPLAVPIRTYAAPENDENQSDPGSRVIPGKME
jgi:cytoskeletal protein CcmA (bactofilin family)